MIRVLMNLAGIFVLAYIAIHLGYARLEKELLTRSCCGIAELPVSPPVQKPIQQDASGKRDEAEQPVPEPWQTHVPQQPGAPAEPNSSLSPSAQGTAATSEPAGSSASDGTAPASPDAVQPVDYEHPDFQVIVRRNIFQLVQADQPEAATQQQPEDVQQVAAVVEIPPTSLNLTLQGTIMGDDDVARAIIIEDKQTEQKLYRIGDAVQGAIIESIERGKVILEVFGARETLLMEKRKGGGPTLPSPPSLVTPPVSQRPPDLMNENIDSEEEREVQAIRTAPRIRPHRRVDFRRNPLRNATDTNEDIQAEEDDELLPEDGLPAIDE